MEWNESATADGVGKCGRRFRGWRRFGRLPAPSVSTDQPRSTV